MLKNNMVLCDNCGDLADRVKNQGKEGFEEERVNGNTQRRIKDLCNECMEALGLRTCISCMFWKPVAELEPDYLCNRCRNKEV